MNLILITLLLQSVVLPAVILPERSALENPATLTQVPRDLQKDYDRVWTRFLTGKEDKKVLEDSEKLLKKNKDFVPAMVVQAYVDLSSGRNADAQRKLEAVLMRDASHRLALYYLAEFAYSRNDFVAATELYQRLLAVDKSRPELELKLQKALLLATDTLLRDAAAAEREGRAAEAKALYDRVQQIAPGLNVNRGDIASERDEIAALENKAALEELEDLGRWGSDIEHFHAIKSAEQISREQFSALVVRYFPQLMEIRAEPEIVIDIENSWAVREIQIALGTGLLDPMPNHTFQPARIVTRSEFARTMARLSRLLGVGQDSVPSATPQDVTSSHALFEDIQLVLGSGLMGLDDAGNFGLDDVMRGEEAVIAVEKLLELTRQTAA